MASKALIQVSTWLHSMWIPQMRFAFLLGAVFWGLGNTNWQVPLTEAAVPLNTSCAHRIELQSGWNIIGQSL